MQAGGLLEGVKLGFGQTSAGGDRPAPACGGHGCARSRAPEKGVSPHAHAARAPGNGDGYGGGLGVGTGGYARLEPERNIHPLTQREGANLDPARRAQRLSASTADELGRIKIRPVLPG